MGVRFLGSTLNLEKQWGYAFLDPPQSRKVKGVRFSGSTLNLEKSRGYVFRLFSDPGVRFLGGTLDFSQIESKTVYIC